MNFTHDGHGYFYSGWVDATKDDKVNIYNCKILVSTEKPLVTAVRY